MEHSEPKIQQFFRKYVESKQGKITEESDYIFSVRYPTEEMTIEYTFQANIAREKKIPLIAPGSLAFQEILKKCSENGVLSQISITPKDSFEALIKKYFKDAPNECINCEKVTITKDGYFCDKKEACFHQINNSKIETVKVIKKEPVKYFQFYFSVTFQNKLRPKNDETITILIDEKGNLVDDEILNEEIDSGSFEVANISGKIKTENFETLKLIAQKKLSGILKDKVALFNLTINKEKKDRIRSYIKRLKRERREHIISKKNDFDYLKWQKNYELLLKKEEESCITNISAKMVNLLIINTSKIRFEINLENNSTIQSSLVLGIFRPVEVTCPICKKPFIEGYATKDHQYLCNNCIRQSIDTGKIYSTKAPLTLDSTLNEYIEKDSGFICTVCGKRHSRLLEFKCSHDNSSICIFHYELCDICGKVFSKLNLTYTDEFKRQLCPKHVTGEKGRSKRND